MVKPKQPSTWQACRTDEEKSAYLAAHPLESLVARGEFRPIEVAIGPRPRRDAHLHMRVEPALIQQLKAAAQRKGVPYQTLVRLWLIERLQQEASAG